MESTDDVGHLVAELASLMGLPAEVMALALSGPDLKRVLDGLQGCFGNPRLRTSLSEIEVALRDREPEQRQSHL